MYGIVHLKYGLQDNILSIISSIAAIIAVLGMIFSALFFISILYKHSE